MTLSLLVWFSRGALQILEMMGSRGATIKEIVGTESAAREGGKETTKIFGLYPVIGLFRQERKERWYYTLLMSTGLTFGTISALYGFPHGIVTQEQYSFLVAAVIASAVVPTAIAGLAFVPSHLLSEATQPDQSVRPLNSFGDEG